MRFSVNIYRIYSSFNLSEGEQAQQPCKRASHAAGGCVEWGWRCAAVFLLLFWIPSAIGWRWNIQNTISTAGRSYKSYRSAQTLLNIEWIVRIKPLIWMDETERLWFLRFASGARATAADLLNSTQTISVAVTSIHPFPLPSSSPLSFLHHTPFALFHLRSHNVPIEIRSSRHCEAMPLKSDQRILSEKFDLLLNEKKSARHNLWSETKGDPSRHNSIGPNIEILLLWPY